jgi:putative peptidoglycan lipid II flippase
VPYLFRFRDPVVKISTEVSSLVLHNDGISDIVLNFVILYIMIIKNSLMLAIFSGVSILLGILRDRLLATFVGVGPVLDVYNASFRIPDLLYASILAFVTAGTVVPFLTKEDKHGHNIDPRHKLSSITLFFGGFMAIVGTLVAVTLPLYAHAIVPGFSQTELTQFIATTRLLLIQPIFLGIISLISCFAQMKNEFFLYALSPLGYSAGIIFGVVVLYPVYGIMGLIYGVLIGCVVSLAIQLYSLKGTKIHTVVGYFSLHHIKELFHLAIPRTGTNVLTQARTIFFTAFATTLGPGALTSYIFAQRISDAFIQIIQQSVTTASLPVLSREFTENNIDNYKRAMVRYVIGLGVVGTVASIFVYIFSKEIIWLLYGGSAFSGLIAFFLVGFLVALPFHMMSGYFSIGFYSAHDTRSVLYANIIASVIAVGTCYYFKYLGAMSLVLGVIAMGLSLCTSLAVLYTKKKLG